MGDLAGSEVVSGAPDLDKSILLKQLPIVDIKNFEEVLRKYIDILPIRSYI